MNCCLKEILYIRIMISNVTKTPPLKETIFDEGQENSPLFIYTGRLHNICVRGLESEFLMILNVCWYVIFIYQRNKEINTDLSFCLYASLLNLCK